MPINTDKIFNIQTNTKPTNANVSQRAYVSSSGALDNIEKDKLDISTQTQKSESKGLSKWVKATIIAGTTTALGLGAFFTHGKIKANQIKKATEEAKKLAEEARTKALEEAKKATEEAKAKAEKEAKLKAEQKIKLKAEQEAKLKAEQEAKLKAEQEAKLKAEQEAKLKAEQEAKLKAEQEAKLKAEQEAKLKAEQEVQLKARAEKVAQNKKTLGIFSTTNQLDNAIIRFKPETFGKDGIPLKYSRNRFLGDLKAELEVLPPEERKLIEEKFDIRLNPTEFNEVGVEMERIPIVPENIGTSKAEQKIGQIIKNFTQENETLIEDPETKKVLDSIIQEFPEFTAVIGKKQHHTHQYSVDVHTIKNLQDNLQNHRLQGLDSDSQLVLKYSTILHDLGKQFISDFCPDEGHARLSAIYTEKILGRMNLSPEIKSRILKQVEFHHWFKDYNMGRLSAKGVTNLFKTKEDITIAEIMARSDLKNVSDNFHLRCMSIPANHSQGAYKNAIEAKLSDIDKIINEQVAENKGLKPDRHGITPISSNSEYYETLEKLKQVKSRRIDRQPVNDIISDSGDYGKSSYILDMGENNVPDKYRALVGYIGCNGPISEIYKDINLYLSKNADIVMKPAKDGTKLSTYMPELINMDSEMAKDFIKCIDYSLKEMDKEFGKFDGVVFRRGRFSQDGGQFYSTSKTAKTGIGDDTILNVIRTKNGHKLSEFQQKYYNKNGSLAEEEILLPRDSKYKEITETGQYSDEKQKFAQKYFDFYKKLDDEDIARGKAPTYNYSMEDILNRIHVWEEV